RTSAVTTAPNAAPITTATARSTTLPRSRNALKSFSTMIPSFPSRARRGSPPIFVVQQLSDHLVGCRTEVPVPEADGSERFRRHQADDLVRLRLELSADVGRRDGHRDDDPPRRRRPAQRA